MAVTVSTRLPHLCLLTISNFVAIFNGTLDHLALPATLTINKNSLFCVVLWYTHMVCAAWLCLFLPLQQCLLVLSVSPSIQVLKYDCYC